MRPVIPVACGVLVDASGAVLIARRPPGKIAAGRWEFPGGKIEPGESAHAALVRELHEELGIEVQQARPLIRLRHDYSDRTVILDTWRVERWRGVPETREGQQLAWAMPHALQQYDLLEADGPIVNALRLPVHYAFTPPQLTEAQLLDGLQRLPANCLLRLRLPRLADDAYAALARRAAAACAGTGIGLMLDRDPALVEQVQAAGLHLSAARIGQLRGRPLSTAWWVAGSAHDAEELRHLRGIADFAVLGPVAATLTHPDALPLGWQRYASLVAESGVPVYALGGVVPADLPHVHACYGQGMAAISAYWSC